MDSDQWAGLPGGAQLAKETLAAAGAALDKWIQAQEKSYYDLAKLRQKYNKDGLEEQVELTKSLQKQIIQHLTEASKSSVKSVADAAAGMLKEIERFGKESDEKTKKIIDGAKSAGKSATSAVTAFNESQLKANAKIYDDIAKLSLDRYDYEREQARRRYQEAVANNEDVFAAHTRMVLEIKQIDAEAAEDRQKAMEKEADAAERLANERISAEQSMHSKLAGQKETGLNHALWLLDREMAELRSKTDNAVLLAEYEAARKKEINEKYNADQVTAWSVIHEQMSTASTTFWSTADSTAKTMLKGLATDGFDGMESAWSLALDRMLSDIVNFGVDLLYEVGKWGLSELFNLGGGSGSIVGSILGGIGSILGLTSSNSSGSSMSDSAASFFGVANTTAELATGQSLTGYIGEALGVPTAVAAVKEWLGIGSEAINFSTGLDVAGSSFFGSEAAGLGAELANFSTGLDVIGSSFFGAETAGIGAGFADAITTSLLTEGAAASAAAESALAAEVAAAYDAMGVGLSIGPGMATAGILAAAELFALAMGEPGPSAIFAGAIADAFGMADKNAMSAEEAQAMVAYQSGSLSEQSSAAAAGDWTGTTAANAMDQAQLAGLAFTATQRHGAGNSIASIGGISSEDIEAQVAAMGPYAQALYDVQAITWEVSDALSAYNEAADMGWFATRDQAEAFRDLANDLGITQQQYRLMIDKGYSYEQIAGAVTQTAGDLRVATVDMSGAISRAAVETGMAAEQANIYASEAAALWGQVQAGEMPLTDFDAWLESTARNMGLSASEAEALAGGWKICGRPPRRRPAVRICFRAALPPWRPSPARRRRPR